MRCSSTGSGSRCGVQKEGEPDFADAAEETAARRIVAGLGGFTLAVEEAAIYLGAHEDTTVAVLSARAPPLDVDRIRSAVKHAS